MEIEQRRTLPFPPKPQGSDSLEFGGGEGLWPEAAEAYSQMSDVWRSEGAVSVATGFSELGIPLDVRLLLLRQMPEDGSPGCALRARHSASGAGEYAPSKGISANLQAWRI